MSIKPNRVLIVDKRLVIPDENKSLEFIQLKHPRNQQDQSFAIDRQSQTLFEVIQSNRPHSCWFINDEYILPDGSLYLITPIHLIFLILPSLWSQARKKPILLKTMIEASFKDLSLDERSIREKLEPICDVTGDEKCSIQLNEQKLFAWFRTRIDRLKKHLNDEEHAFDLLCEYLPDEIIERCQDELQLHGNVKYELPVGQKSMTITTSTLYLIQKRSSLLDKASVPLSNDQNHLSGKVIEHAKQVLFDHHLQSSQSSSFHEFHLIQNQSDCIFAKRARCWGSPSWNADLSIEDNCERLLPSFILFCSFVKETAIDGYAIEIPHDHSTATIEDFARIFQKILRYLSDHDPAKRHCMSVSPSHIDKPSWVFEFDRVTFFITTFTPHYSETHPRYTFGCRRYCHILFQPEISFLRHDLPNDTPETNWSHPTTSRDKIRVAFRTHGREYPIRPTIYYPMAQDMIRPLSNDLDDIVQWWL